MVLQLVEVFLEAEKEFDGLLGVDTTPCVEPHGRISPDGQVITGSGRVSTRRARALDRIGFKRGGFDLNKSALAIG